MPNLAITGSKGRLASAMLPLLEHGDDVWTKLSRDKGDSLTSYDELDQFPDASLDTIVHLAWSSVPSTAQNDPALSWIYDFPLIERLVNCRALKGDGQFVFFSSGGTVYGETTGTEVDETSCLRPIGQYGAAKVYAEQLVRQLCSKRGIRPVILRLTNPYGFHSGGNIPQGVIGYAMDAAMRGNIFNVWGDGTTTKDYIHINDVVAALRSVLNNGLEGVFNLSSGNSTPLVEVLALIERASGMAIRIKYCPSATWDVGMGRISNERLQLASGWQPEISLMHGLEMEWKRFAGEKPSPPLD